jgi:hypothetical protein
MYDEGLLFFFQRRNILKSTQTSPFKALKQPTTKTIQQADNYLLNLLKNKPFFCGNMNQPCNNQCTWDILGRPERNGINHPLLPAQQLVVNALFDETLEPWKRRHIIYMASRGAGKSTLILRILIHLATRNDDFRGTDMVICCGNRVEAAKDLIKRLHREMKFSLQETKEDTAIINGVRVTAYPAQHVVSVRHIERASACWGDESQVWNHTQADEIQDIFNGFIPKIKDGPFIIYSGTANKPNDLLDKLFNEPDTDSIYQKFKHPYSFFPELYLPQDLVKIQKSKKSWSREMLLEVGFGSGTCFNSFHIDKCIIPADTPPLDISNLTISCGTDPAHSGSADGSKYGVSAVAINPANGKVRVLISEQYSGLSNSQSLNVLQNVLQRLGFNSPADKYRFRIFCDSASPGTISDIKQAIFGESHNWDDINRTKEYGIKNNIKLANLMFCVPVSFSADGLTLLQKFQDYVSDGMLEIPSYMTDLILQMRTSKLKPNLDLEKASGPSDLIDSMRLALNYVNKS